MGDNDFGSVCPSVFPFIRDLSIRMNISNTMLNILNTCIYYNPPMNPVKCRQDQIQNGRHIAIFVCSNWQKYSEMLSIPMNISQHQWTFLLDTLNTHALTTVLPWILCSFVWINLKWPTYCNFCLLKLLKYFLVILYTCIYYNPPMNAVKFRQDQMQNGQFIAIFVCLNWQFFLKMCQSGWISPNRPNFLHMQ